MLKAFRILTLIVLISTLFLPAGSSIAATTKADLTAEEKASILLQQMTPEERVGQLFLVTFQGTDTGIDSNIQNLILNQHVGGLVLRADNDNFSVPEETTTNAQTMITSLQMSNWEFSKDAANTQEAINTNPYVPLLIGISQEGDLAPYDQIINGLTPLPDEMAIGATWKPDNAEAIGTILGRELHALGVNLLFGPSLDVLDTVKTDTGEDLGTRTFGGDPYWVGEMGKAYIRGVHTGSDNQIAVIATHFPGRGGSDRQPEDEVATVRKSLEQLKQIELAPFFAVTQENEVTAEITDGLLLSHIRYQGFQGNIRATTRPVSFDATALEQLMNLEEFTTWRNNGGILISDDLGSTAVSKFFDPMNTGFDARQVIKTALLAGNDLLYTGNIIASGDDSTYTTIVRTHEYFVQKYREDSAFQKRVDEAALRVLTLKFKIYSEFQLSNVLPKTSDLEKIGNAQDVTFDVARQAITLISPELSDLDTVLQEPPQSNDRIVFISNKISQLQCSTCTDQSIFLADNFRNAVERLYGPMAGEQIQSFGLSAYSFDDLALMLDGGNAPENMKSDISSADWIVISFTEFPKSSTESVLLQRFFSEYPELSRDKKVIGFAFNAPYYLDATDISKFTAYYAVYSKIPVFVEVAARILFREIGPTGVLPVSLSSIGYDLITATTPDPEQIIPLMVEEPISEIETTETATATASETPLVYNVGDSLMLKTGVILDQNGNPVPDGTIVKFIITSNLPSTSTIQTDTQTVDGVARMTYQISNIGLLEIKVTADPAQVSQILSLDITDAGGILTSILPTFAPTDETETAPSTEVVETPVSSENISHQQGNPTFPDWLLCSFVIFGIAAILYWWGGQKRILYWNPRLPFLSGLGGYLAYFGIVVGVPGSGDLVKTGGSGMILLIVLGGSAIGIAAGYVWLLIERKKRK